MIFIFRRIRNALLKRNQFFSYVLYALGEIVLVVFGILIAVSIDDWNQERKNNIEGVDYRRRLMSDLLVDQWNIEQRIAFFEAVIDFALVAEDHIREADAETLEEKWEFVYAAYQTSQIWPYRASITTFTELQSTGMIQYLAPDTLLNLISKYYLDSPNQLEQLTGGTTSYRDFTRGITPTDVQTFIWEHCFAANNLDQQKFMSCSPPADMKSLIEETYMALKHDKDFKRLLTRRIATLNVREIIHENILLENLEIQNGLKKFISLNGE